MRRPRSARDSPKDALAVRVDGEVRDLAAPARRRRGDRDRHPGPTTRTRSTRFATTPRTCWPPRCSSCGRDEGLDRPADRRRLLLRLRVPRRRFSPSDSDLERIEEAMAAHVRPTSRSSAPRSPRTRRSSASARGPALQGRADRGPRARRGYRDGLAVPQRPVRRPLPRARTGPRPAGSRRSSSTRSPARTGAATRTRQMLTRIYGTAFFCKKDLAEHLERIEQARARDHRRLGPELGLFTLLPESPGDAVLAARGNGAPPAGRGRGARATRAAAATRRSRPHTCSTRSCGTGPATGTTTARTCSSRSPSGEPTARSAASP